MSFFVAKTLKSNGLMEVQQGKYDSLWVYTPFLRSAREERQGKTTPTEILTGASHPHWLEMLGYQRFKKAALLN